MNQSNIIETWLSQVAYSHSQSKSTEHSYRNIMAEYCKFQNTTPEKILAEYETIEEKIFKHKHTQQLQNYMTSLFNRKLAILTIKSRTAAIMSFYKYNQLSLGFIPKARKIITYHNRDIEAKEIAQIIAHSQLREKAFYSIMAQSGLRPYTLSKLKIKNIEPLNSEKKAHQITIPSELAKGQFGSYVTFIGGEATKYLKEYLTTRTNLTPESLLFCAHNNPNSEINTKNMSRAFQKQATKLKKTGNLNYETKVKGKPAEIRLYNLRKFFKRKCKDMGDEDTNYLMGHTTNDSNGNYRPQSPEYYRKRYEDKALPFLVLEEPSPSDTKELTEALKTQMETQHIEQMEAMKNNYEKEIKLLKEKFKQIGSSNQIQELKQELANQQDYMNKLTTLIYSLVDQKDKEPKLIEKEMYVEYQRKLKLTEEQRKTEEQDLEKGLKSFETPREDFPNRVEHLDWEGAFNSLLKRINQLETLNSEKAKR
jgi:integrase